MLGMMTVLALALSAVVPADEAPDSLTVEQVAANGSGCTDKRAKVEPLANRRGFTVALQHMTAKAGGGAGPVEFRKNCQINVRLKFPPEYTFGVEKVDHQGSVQLQAGATATIRTNHYFAGGPSTGYLSHTFTGPLNEKWTTSDVVPADQVFYPPCGQSWNLNANVELRVNKMSSNELNTFSLSPGHSSTYHLKWRKC